MNKILLSSVLSIVALCMPTNSRGSVKISQPDKDNSTAIIEGVTTIIPDSVPIVLFRFYGDAGMSVARDTVTNGKFRIEYAMNEDEVLKLDLTCFAPGITGTGRTIFLTPGACVKVDASTPDSRFWDVTSTLKEQQEYDKILFSCADIYKIINDIDTEKHKLLSNPDLTPEKKRNIIAESSDAISRLNDSINRREYLTLLQMEHTPVWFDKLESLSKSLSSGDTILATNLRALYESLEPGEKESATGERIGAYLYPESKINLGDKVPDTEFIDINGTPRNLGEFSGKWLLLDIWSGGCGPCHMSVPELKAFAEKHKDDVEVISISIDDDEFWKMSTDLLKVEGNNWNDRKGTAGIYSRFNAKGLPTFITIDPEGIYTSTKVGYGNGMFERMFRRLLNPKPEMTVEKTNDAIEVKYPDCSENNTNDILEIDSIELNNDRTVIHFHMYYLPNWWIKISPESYLELPDGSKLNIIEAEGIKVGEEFRAEADGENRFSLTFPVLDKNIEQVSFIESPSWNIKGIRLAK